MVDPTQHIRDITKQSKTNFYYSFLLLPKEKRDAIFTAYSFCRYSDDIVDDIDDVDEARKTLDEWRDELERCFAGHSSHPIMKALEPVVHTYQIPKDHFHALIDGCEMDLSKKRYQTFDELSEYCYHVASVVGLICIEIFGYRSSQTRDYAVNLGKALQMTNIMRDVKEDAENGRIYLPIEDLERFGYSEEKLLRHEYNESFVDMMRFQHDRAQAFYSTAMQHFEPRDAHLLFPAEIMRKIYYKLLHLIHQEEYNVFQRRIRVCNFQKGTIALNTWLRSRWSFAKQCITTPSS